MRRIRVNPSVAFGVLTRSWNEPANRDQRAKAVARSLRYQARGRVLGKSTIVPYGRASRVEACFDDVGSRRAAYSPIPDYPEMSVWLKALTHGSLFVDVGANVGLYSVLAAECGAEVVACEPLPEARRQLEANMALNDYEVAVHPVAIAEAPGTMFLDGVDAQRMHLTNQQSAGATEVEVTTLDSVVGNRTVDGLKIDVEGAERLVLEGASAALSEHRLRLIQLEWNDTSQSNFGEGREPAAALLTEAGYELLRPTAQGELRPIVDLAPGADVFARPNSQGG